jgi:hypothetical protein
MVTEWCPGLGALRPQVTGADVDDMIREVDAPLDAPTPDRLGASLEKPLSS